MVSRSLLLSIFACSLHWHVVAKKPTVLSLKNTGAHVVNVTVHYNNPFPKRTGRIGPIGAAWIDESSYATPTSIDLYLSSNIGKSMKTIPAEEITLETTNKWEINTGAGNAIQVVKVKS